MSICIIKNCNNKVMSMGNGKRRKLCSSHHKMKYGMPLIGPKTKRKWGPDAKEIYKMSQMPCHFCGWNESYCDRHRIIPEKDGGKYTKENVIPLCPNCHMVETMRELLDGDKRREFA